jgi:hypothetical protein
MTCLERIIQNLTGGLKLNNKLDIYFNKLPPVVVDQFFIMIGAASGP